MVKAEVFAMFFNVIKNEDRINLFSHLSPLGHVGLTLRAPTCPILLEDRGNSSRKSLLTELNANDRDMFLCREE